MKPDFSKAQNEATKLLLKQDFDSLNIDVRNFQFNRNIKIDSIQHYAKIVNKNVSDFCCSELSGCLVLKVPKFGLSIILYDDSEKNERRKHWGIVHEIGHIYLDHTSDGDVQEIEANFFAAQIVTPEIVLINFAKMQGGHLSSDDIYENFNCSSTSSRKRIKTLSSYTWSYNDYDRMLLAKFKPIIKHIFDDKEMAQSAVLPAFVS